MAFAGSRNRADRPAQHRLPLPPRSRTTKGSIPTRDQYTIGWIAALHIELASAMVMLDFVYDEPADFEQPENDKNVYTYGSIRKHYIVIANLPAGLGYTLPAATTTQSLMSSFPNVSFCLLVGIGGAVPGGNHDIRLGDVAIGGQGIYQYDYGKSQKDDEWIGKSELNKPPELLLKALSKLLALHEQANSGYKEIWAKVTLENDAWSRTYNRPIGVADRLFHTGYDHETDLPECHECDFSQEVERPERETTDPQIHNGIIASGNSVVKDSKRRDSIGQHKRDIICLEMEAAGVGNFPCLVIRGICDYADSHKNDVWQRYASAVAAAIAKALLRWVPPKPSKKPMHTVSASIESVTGVPAGMDRDLHSAEAVFIRDLNAPDYETQYNNVALSETGTCSWFTNHRIANQWWYSEAPFEAIWLTGEESCGKTVLVRHNMDIVFPDTDTICYYFFKNEVGERSSVTAALRAILHQIFTKLPLILRKLLQRYDYISKRANSSFGELWELFQLTLDENDVGRLVIMLDGFDHCQDRDRLKLLKKIGLMHNKPSTNGARVKLLITSRMTPHIRFAYNYLESRLDKKGPRHVHRLNAYGREESTAIEKEIRVVINARLDKICEVRRLSAADKRQLEQALDRVPKHSYFWINRMLRTIETNTGNLGLDELKTAYEECENEAFAPGSHLGDNQASYTMYGTDGSRGMSTRS